MKVRENPRIYVFLKNKKRDSKRGHLLRRISENYFFWESIFVAVPFPAFIFLSSGKFILKEKFSANEYLKFDEKVAKLKTHIQS